jgi:hypothetical protein
MWVYCEDEDDDSEREVCKFSQRYFNSFMISQRMGGKLCDFPRKGIGICEKILRSFDKLSGAFKVLRMFSRPQDGVLD